MVYHMAKQRWQQAIYVRKKWNYERKWINIGYLSEDGSVTLTITEKEAAFLVSDKTKYNWFRQVAKKWFN